MSKPVISREQFIAEMRMSNANCIADASDSDLSRLYDSFILLLNHFQKQKELSEPAETFEDEDSDDEYLDRCEECNEYAWDGRICHACGMKEI